MIKKHFIIVLALISLFLTAPFGNLSNAAPPVTVLWFNAAYSPLTAMNKADFNEIGGYASNGQNRQFMRELLSDWWNVTDRRTADETLQWLLNEGHRSGFIEEMTYYKKHNMLMTTKNEWLRYTKGNASEAACQARMCKIYKERGSHAIDAWDYCRAMQLLGQYYVAGYYTKEESLNASLAIAKKLQQTYHSWEDLMQGYNDGYQYWCGDDITEPGSKSYTRNQVIFKLKTDPGALINTVAWDTPLTKSW